MFKKYNSIENSYQTEFVDRIKTEGLDTQKFVVQEKAHGANMSFWTLDGIHYQYGKRTGELDWKDEFYHFQSVFLKNKEKLQMLWNKVTNKYKHTKVLHVFGELIGGSYKHPDVAKDKKAIQIQKGIYYSPSNEFYGFDIMINYKQYLTVYEANALFEEAELLHAKNLFEGSLSECLAFPNDFESTIFRQLHYPQIIPNIAEGVVIKPKETCFFQNGQRVILKNKNKKWEEVAKRRKTPKSPLHISDEVSYLQDEILNYITQNRFNNLLSKIGPIHKKDFSKLMGMFTKDIVEDFEKDFGKQMNELDKQEQKLVKKSISKPVSILINLALKD